MRPRKRRNGRTRFPKTARNPCRAMVLTDARAILEPLRQLHAAVQKKLSQTETAIERFERQDKPAFEKWVATEFGALLTEIRQIRQDAGPVTTLLDEWETEMFESRLGELEAFHKVKLRQAGLLPDPPEPAPEDDGAPPEDGGEDGAQDEDIYFLDAFAKLFEAMTGRPPQGFDEIRDNVRRMRRADRPPQNRILLEARRLYREIVRRLHPDRNGEMSPLARDLWESAREAHLAGNAEALSMILARLDAMEHGIEKIDAPSVLAGIVRGLQQRLAQLAKLQRSLRRDLAWGFARLKDRARIRARVDARLKRDCAEAADFAARARMELERLERAYAKWLAARRRPRRKPRPVPPNQPDLIL